MASDDHERAAQRASDPEGSPLEGDLTQGFRQSGAGAAPLSPVLPEQCFAQVAPPARPAPPQRTSRSDSELPAAGAILDDKYRLEECVGCGAFAAVYRATHLLLRRPVAVKLLRPSAVRRVAGLAQMLCEEARFAAGIQHPSVVRIFDVTQTRAITYVVMEYIEGRNLAEVIASEGAQQQSRVVRVGLEIAAGLNAALAQGLIHRDVKPSNVLLGRAGEAKLVDSGLALPLGGSEPAARLSQLSVVGTPGYMAPEQGAAPAAVDFRADVYALGATLYHAAVGAPPFPLDDAQRCLALHRDTLPPPPKAIRPSIAPELSDLLLWMLAKSPSERPASYADLTEAMEDALARIPA